SRHLALLIHLWNGRDAVIGRQNDESIAGPDLAICVIQEFAEETIDTDRDVAHRRIVWTDGVPDIVVGREADGKDVGATVLAELFSVDRPLGELLDHLIAPWRRLQAPAEPDRTTRNHRAKSRRRVILSIERLPGLAEVARIHLFFVQLLNPGGKIGAVEV